MKCRIFNRTVMISFQRAAGSVLEFMNHGQTRMHESHGSANDFVRRRNIASWFPIVSCNDFCVVDPPVGIVITTAPKGHAFHADAFPVILRKLLSHGLRKGAPEFLDRKSTRLNSSHSQI